MAGAEQPEELWPGEFDPAEPYDAETYRAAIITSARLLNGKDLLQTSGAVNQIMLRLNRMVDMGHEHSAIEVSQRITTQLDQSDFQAPELAPARIGYYDALARAHYFHAYRGLGRRDDDLSKARQFSDKIVAEMANPVHSSTLDESAIQTAHEMLERIAKIDERARTERQAEQVQGSSLKERAAGFIGRLATHFRLRE